MNKRFPTRLLSGLLALVMVFTMLPAISASAAGTDSWIKVTEEPADWSGTYLLVYETDGFVFDGSKTSSDLNAASNYVSASISDGVITGDYSDNAVEIAQADGGYTIRTASGYYIYHTGSSNTINYNHNTPTLNAISMTDGVLKIAQPDSTYELRFNPSAGVFRFYKGTQQPVSLYKLTASSGSTDPEPEQPGDPQLEEVAAPTASVEAGAVLAGTEVSFSCATEGAALSYKLGDGEYQAYTGPVAITEAVTITVKASKEGMTDKEASFTYTIKELPTGTPFTRVSTVSAGDVVAIVVGGNYMTKESGAKGPKGASAAEYINGDTLTVTDAFLTLTVAAGESEGQFYLLNSEGKYMTSGATGNSISWAAAPGSPDYSLWELVEIGGTTLVSNVNAVYTKTSGDVTTVSNQALEYYSEQIYPYSYLKTATSIGDAFAAVIYKNEAAVPTVLNPSATPAAGEVDAGTEITFATATEGAVISYKLGNGEYQVYTAPVTVTEDTTFTVKAEKDGYAGSEEVTFVYTIRTVQSRYATLVEGDGIADGDLVLIYSSSGTAVLGTEASGAKLAGVTATPTADNKIAIAEGMAELEVELISAATDTEAAVYAFLSSDGKYLTSGATGNGLSYSDTLTDCGKWTCKITDGFLYIHNVGANYNGNYNQGMEYYNGFTTYGEKTTAPYRMAFYKSGVAPILRNGAQVVIYNPANNMALSSSYSGNYNAGTPVAMTDGVLSGFGAADVWTVGVTTAEDGSYLYTFSTADGKKLSMDTSYSSMPLDKVNDSWSILPTGTGLYQIKNIGRASYMEWYSSKTYWSCYNKITDATADLFAMDFYPVTELPQTPTGALTEGAQVVIYNASAESAFGQLDEAAGSLAAVPTTLTGVDGTIYAVPGNGALVFTVGIDANGDYTFRTGDKYLALTENKKNDSGSTINDENLLLLDEVNDYCKWYLEEKGDGAVIYSRAGLYYSSHVCIEYFSSAFSGWTFKTTNDAAIYIMNFYPVAEGTDIVSGVVDKPTVSFSGEESCYVGTDYTFTTALDSYFGGESSVVITAAVGDETLTLTPDEEGIYTIPHDKLTAGISSITLTASGTDTMNVAITGSKTILVKDEPFIVAVTPVANSQTHGDKQPAFTVEFSNAGEDFTIVLTVNDVPVELTDITEAGAITKTYGYTPAAAMEDGRVSCSVLITRADGKTVERTWNFTIGESRYQLYFGQLHAHTAEYSDGAGTLNDALNYIYNISEDDNVQFVAFTDHSNYFDASSAANPEGAIYDLSLATAASQTKWNSYTTTSRSFNTTQSKVVAIPGFEMTWSGGPGHINTFNTTGVVSRNNSTLNNKTDNAGIQAYYKLLSQEAGASSVNQFNHPGTTFGTFIDFSFWDAIIDTRFQLVEVGNGEGAIGSGGYFPSYEEYIKALDKGWHVAPSNNQDNHKGKWGNANTARDVILTDDFSEAGLLEAIRQRRVYATEDKNLEIHYTLNGYQLGSVIETVPEKLNINVTLYDPNASDSISKVEVVVNSGKTIYTWDDPADLADGAVSCELDPGYSYYLIRVTQGDGDLAITAPVWVGETLKLGISSLTCGSATPVTNEPMTLTTSLFNSEATTATVKSVTYTTNGSVVLGVDTTEKTVSAVGTLDLTYDVSFSAAKVYTVTVTVVLEQDGKEYTFSKDIELDVADDSKLLYIGVDAAHYNEYVAGNYKDSVGNFTALAAGYNLRVVTLKTSEELIAACGNEKYVALVFSAPSRRLAAAQTELLTYTEAEIAAITAFNNNGGAVIVSGWSDYYENYDVIKNNATSAQHMAATQNALLEALGTTLRVSDDATYDDSYNGGQAQRLYFATYNMDNPLLKGVETDSAHLLNYSGEDKLYTEFYSQYGGATIYCAESTLPATVSPAVYGHASTYSKDSDSDGLGGTTVPKYATPAGDSRLLVMASDSQAGKGIIIVAGAAFFSDFEVQTTAGDNGAEKNYSNYKICENLCEMLNPVQVTPIAEVRVITETGFKYTIEGIVTSNASGYDKNTAFFDCIYVQDATGGICCFPVAGNYKVGDKVRITGTTDFYQGEAELQVSSITKLEDAEPLQPTEITAAQLNDTTAEGTVRGDLVKLSGVVTEIAKQEGLIQTIMVKDTAGNLARVFIDGYICSDSDIEGLTVGCTVEAIGLASYDDTFEGPAPRIRVRNRAEITILAAAANYTVAATSGTPDGTATVTTVTGGGSYLNGTEATVTVSAVPGYKFLGWYMKNAEGVYETIEGATELSYTFTVSADVELKAVYQPVASFNLTVSGTAFRVDNGTIQRRTYNASAPAGTAVTLSYVGDDVFYYWTNANGKILSTSATYTFYMTTATTIFEYVSVAGEADSAYVIFTNGSGQVLSSETYTTEDTITPPAAPSKMGKVFSGWSMTEEQIKAAMATEDTVVVDPVFTSTGETYDVTVSFEGIEREDMVYEGNTSGKFCTVTAPEQAGSSFLYWKLDGSVISYSEACKLASTRDLALTAVYGIETVAKQPMVSLIDISGTCVDDVYKLRIVQLYDVPAGYTLVESGILVAAAETYGTPETLVLENVGSSGVRKGRCSRTEANYSYVLNLKVAGADAVNYLRGYLVFNDGTNQVTVYSDITQTTYNQVK